MPKENKKKKDKGCPYCGAKVFKAMWKGQPTIMNVEGRIVPHTCDILDRD